MISINAGAAPATVNSEPLSKYATDAKSHREGETAALNYEPGDLPQRMKRLWAGCPSGSHVNIRGTNASDVFHTARSHSVLSCKHHGVTDVSYQPS